LRDALLLFLKERERFTRQHKHGLITNKSDFSFFSLIARVIRPFPRENGGTHKKKQRKQKNKKIARISKRFAAIFTTDAKLKRTLAERPVKDNCMKCTKREAHGQYKCQRQTRARERERERAIKKIQLLFLSSTRASRYAGRKSSNPSRLEKRERREEAKKKPIGNPPRANTRERSILSQRTRKCETSKDFSDAQ